MRCLLVYCCSQEINDRLVRYYQELCVSLPLETSKLTLNDILDHIQKEKEKQNLYKSNCWLIVGGKHTFKQMQPNYGESLFDRPFRENL
ncbi:hypothetical protein F3F27_06275 [Bacteroides ovatus]|uniref:Uncharacterized protein n=1 Tax=Bacteroides ovatus TaxID=28116 RepID=A0A6N3VE41_BACOV|nr:hypothetical protein F3F97_13070 [Bacteroides ovatus]KAA3809558.1 hypothetical protein F3F51_01605 [Bacteroides ovatus]KAA3810306.1 hypothetical protein F3F64_00280 [Bacteroides ovatus]KAA3818175.1 hypothetical protein F3F87_02640 [Bacteroides ovatus]KAA3821117.1 hypothetical protein F3F58_22255 [Bacteroides ovatus]